MTRKSTRWPSMLVWVFALAMPLSAFAQDPVALDFPAQSLAESLGMLGKQTETNILIDPKLVGDLQAPALKGILTADQALTKLLAGTSLRHRFVNEHTVVLTPSADSPVKTSQVTETSQLYLVRAESSAMQQEDSPARPATADKSTRTEGKIEEVVVTAQRRAERVQDVPISMSVLSGEVLDKSTFKSVNEALREVPGVSMLEQGQTGLTKLTIRGVSSNTSFINSSSTVGYYMDETPFGFVRFPLVPDVGVYDVERVEVLRGPQGTLYGASSLNGVVRILTKDADLNAVEFKARTTLSSTKDGSDNYRGDAALSVPLVAGKLAVRGVAGYADNGGWLDEPVSGKKDINDGIQKNYRLKVNAAPTERFHVEAAAIFSRDDRDSTTATARDDRTSATGHPQEIINDYDSYGLTLTYDFPAVSLLSATNHIKFSGLSLLNAGATTSLLDSSITKFGGELTSQEFRLSSTLTGPWRWSAGAIYRDEKDSQYFDLLNNAAFPVTLQGIDSNIFTSKSFAVFGELTRTFFDNKLELTGGLRYFEDDASSNELTTIDLTASAPFGLRKDSFDAVTPRVVLTYKPGSSANYYASYSQGFRSGFSQNGVAQRVTAGAAPGVRPDRLSNYEIGTKGRALDGLLNYELAAYYIDWKDTIQVLTTIIAGATVNAALNSSGVAGPGVDAAATLKLFDRLDLSATLSWNDLGFVDDVISRPGGVVTVIYPKDSRPPQSSKTTAGLGIDYTMPLPGEYAGRFSGGVTYLSKMLTAAFTTSAALAGDDLTIVRASYTLEAPAGWSAMLFVDNLADENGRISPASPANSGAVSDRLRPRTYGLQLDYRFH